ncbi:MAG: RNA pseudouridine synthase [Deltaproteobacteria bacterium]|nr:RNA pseudouridine synthase [Deltaproteobacteria bacterium]
MPRARPAAHRHPPPAVSVLHHEPGLIVVDKPAGLVTEPTRDPLRPSVLSVVRAQLQRPADAVLAVPHRLDRDTSGVLLLALEPAMLATLNEAFAARTVHKSYLAVVHGVPTSTSGTWESFLGQVGRDQRRVRWGAVRSGGKKAITHYEVRARHADHSLVECRPQTGRTHQLRVHLSEAGHPIVGDEMYGAPAGEHATVGRHLLHAWKLSIPSAADPRTFEAPIPAAFDLGGATR